MQLDFSQQSASNSLTDSISMKVIHYLQVKQADSIYAMAGANFKNALSQEKFESVVNEQLLPLNDFKQVSFVKTISGINKYKVEGTPQLQLLVGLDKSNLLQTFLVQPFSEN